MKKQNKVKRVKHSSWRSVPDTVILALTPDSKIGNVAQSLHPDAAMMWAYTLGEPNARAAIDCWAFHAPITVVQI
jgi:hypothetical protein